MKKKTLLTVFLLHAASVLTAQTIRQEIEADVHRSASSYMAYPTPAKPLTPAPKGYKPVYMSHYGRHGSRYHIGTQVYDEPYRTLMRADSAGKLTALGRDALRRVAMLREEARLRDGELTELGAEQHRQIAERMWQRFPEIFKGRVRIEARSTVVIRCILSMENELQQLLRHNPRLQIFHDASAHDMYFMRPADKLLSAMRTGKAVSDELRTFARERNHCSRLLRSLINDTAYISKMDTTLLCDQLFKLAANVQSSELREHLTLYDLFTQNEIYERWEVINAGWYLNYGPSAVHEGRMPFIRRALLRDVITKADSCLRLEHPGATLRFGHETVVLPFACLLGLNGYDQPVDSLQRLAERGWVNYKVFPMASNVQFVFYRHASRGKPVLVKVLLNEEEARLPISTDTHPYYEWDAVRQYYLDKLAAYDSKWERHQAS